MKNILLIAILLNSFICNIFAQGNSFTKTDNETVALKEYVDKLISYGYNLVNNKTMTEKAKIAELKNFIDENLHSDWMGKTVLGRNKKNLSEEKIKEFLSIYDKFLIRVYSDLIKHYDGEKAIIRTVKKIDDYIFIVSIEVVKPSTNNTIKIDYLVHKIADNKNTAYKVGDIITEGVSMLNSQQAEFNSVILNQGIDSLITDLNKRINRN